MALHSGRLTPTDASFLYIERPEAPMHIGAVGVYDGVLPFEPYLGTVEAKLAHLPRFRERIVATPLHLGHPTWETDVDFDIRNHLLLHQLPAPGDMDALRDLASELIEGVMDRSRPLWEIHVIQGLEGGRSAFVSKVHHCMVDGVGGNEILTTILDLTPEPSPPPPRDYEPTGGMSTRERVVEALWDSTRTRIEAWSEYFKGLTELGRSFDGERARTTLGVMSDILPDLALPPKRLPFNRHCSGKRRLSWAEISFAEARAIRGALGGTVNDVILTALGGAVGRYCERHDVKTDGRTMRIMVPVNVRRDEDRAALGNQVSLLPVTVPIGLTDPHQRLLSVREATRALKAAKVADGVSLMSTLMGTVPAPFQAGFGALAVSPTPVFNMVCTNVPGPQIPLYAEGVPLISYYPYIPTGFDMGVGCAIFSYNQRLFFGLSADLAACPDIDDLRGDLEASFAELRRAAGVGEIEEVEFAAGRGKRVTGPPAREEKGKEAELEGNGRTKPASKAKKGSGAKKGSAPKKKRKKRTASGSSATT